MPWHIQDAIKKDKKRAAKESEKSTERREALKDRANIQAE